MNKVDVRNSVTNLNRRPISNNWWLGVAPKNTYQKDMCLRETEMRA